MYTCLYHSVYDYNNNITLDNKRIRNINSGISSISSVSSSNTLINHGSFMNKLVRAFQIYACYNDNH